MSKNGRPSSTSLASDESVTLRDRLLWTCPIVGFIAAAVIFWLFGVMLWTVIAVVFLIACPLVVVWILAIERRQAPFSRKKP